MEYMPKLRAIKLITVFLSLLYSVSAIAQEKQYDSTLGKQLGQYQYEFQDLMHTRGFVHYSSGKIEVELIEKALSYYAPSSTDFFLVFYHFQEGELWCWLITKNGVIAKQAVRTSAKELSELEMAFKHSIGVTTHTTSPDIALRNKKIIKGTERGFKIKADDSLIPHQSDSIRKRLCDIVMPANIAKVILNTGHADSVKHLLIIPELNIAAIPLYLLQPFGDSTYLIDRASVCIEHSFDELLNRVRQYYAILYPGFYDTPYLYESYNSNIGLQRNRVSDFIPKTPLIIGNPDFSDCDDFNSLNGARQEAQYAADALNAKLVTGKAASKKYVLNMLKQSELLYFATHAIADDKHPLDSGYLVLANCEHWDGIEIENDTFQKEAIVILSACQTGLGKAVEAGIMGVGRSFIKGGAGNVIMSLWSVDDKSTRDLMHLVIDELKVPHNFFPADNLREAILKYKKHNSDPAVWAPFTIMGTPYPLNFYINMKVD